MNALTITAIGFVLFVAFVLVSLALQIGHGLQHTLSLLPS